MAWVKKFPVHLSHVRHCPFRHHVPGLDHRHGLHDLDPATWLEMMH
jgi:hypothetical protein